MNDPISLIVPDAGPLISLAMADRLDLLDEFSVPIATLDVVKAECLVRDWPGRSNLERWFGANDGRVEIISSPIMPLYLKAVGAAGQTPTATRGLGDASIAWFVANVSLLRRHAHSFKRSRRSMSSLRRRMFSTKSIAGDGESHRIRQTGRHSAAPADEQKQLESRAAKAAVIVSDLS